MYASGEFSESFDWFYDALDALVFNMTGIRALQFYACNARRNGVK